MRPLESLAGESGVFDTTEGITHILDRAGDPRSRSQVSGCEKHKDADRRRHRKHSHGKRGAHERKHVSQNGGSDTAGLEASWYKQSIGQLVAARNDEKSIFTIDHHGDPDNLRYGSLHRYSVPRYKLAGYGRVVGLPSNYKIISHRESDSRVISIVSLDTGQRNKAKSLISITGKPMQHTAQIMVKSILSDQDDRTQNFLSLDSHTSVKRRRIGRATLKPSRSAPEDPGLSESGSTESDSDAQHSHDLETSFKDFRQSAKQQRQVELSLAVRDRPKDLQAWIDLVNHQDIFLEAEHDGERRARSTTQKRGVAEIKISIYDQALSMVKLHPSRDRLILGLMEEGVKVWDTKKMSNEWTSMLKSNPGYLSLWCAFLDFQQTNFVTFTYEQCMSVYAECLALMTAQPPSPEREEIQIYVTMRMTVLMREAGFSENATAIWQANLEFSSFQPANPQTAQFDSFEEFWDREVARIGEENAAGWRSATGVDLEPRTDSNHKFVSPHHIFETWVEAERERTLCSRLPARTIDHVAEDDPYRVIIFSDVKDYIFRPSTADGLHLLLNAFLRFCNTPPLVSDDDDGPRPWWADPFLCTDLRRSKDSSQSDCKSGRLFTNSMAPYFLVDTTTLFASPNTWFSAWREDSISGAGPLDLNWLHRALCQMVEGLQGSDLLAEYVIALKVHIDLKEARKYAKTLLKKRSSSLRLYNTYALIEARSGNFGAAESVWSTALTMSKTFSHDEQQDAILLWRSWMWELLDMQKTETALQLLLSMPHGVSTIERFSKYDTAVSANAAAILQARRHLETHLSHSLSLRRNAATAQYTDLLAVLSYLTTNGNLATASSIYSKVFSGHYCTSNPTSTLCELLHQSRARLVHFHVTSSKTGGHKPSELSSALADSVKLFPNNTIFLTLYHHHTQHAMLMDRIRSTIPTLDNALDRAEDKNKKLIVPHVFSIWSELNRPSYAGSTTHSIRAAFERAVEVGAAGQHCIAIWKWYLSWELSLLPSEGTNTESTTMIKSKKAKAQHEQKAGPLARTQDIFYRGIRACPWAKQLYMLAFSEEILRDAIGFQGLRGLYETMVEKGLRIHVDLGEVLEEWDEREKRQVSRPQEPGS